MNNKLNKKFLLTTLFLFIGNFIFSQSADWWWATAPVARGTVGNAIITDGSGNTYVTGGFSGTPAYFDGIALNSNEIGQHAVFVVKYDSLGRVIWVNRGGNINVASPTAHDRGYGISLDKIGNVYVTGNFRDTAVFGNDTIISKNNSEDIFIAKYDTSGIFQWVKQEGGNYIDLGKSIVADSTGNSFITGFFQDTLIIGADTLIGDIAHTHYFVAAYDSSGNRRWAKQVGGATGSIGNSVTLFDSNILVTGNFGPAVIFSQDTLISAGGTDIFLVKYDTTGNVIWAKDAGGSSIIADESNGISTDGSGNIYITGYASDGAVFDTDTTVGNGIFIAKYDSSGNEQWAKHDVANPGNFNSANSISTDIYGNSFITGEFSDTIIFDSDTLFDNGTNSILTAKFDNNGNLVWMITSSDGRGVGFGISADNFGSCFITGRYSVSITLGATILNCIDNNALTAKIGCNTVKPFVSIVNGILHSTSAVSYQWFLNGNLIAGAVSQDYIPIQDGDYVVEITDSIGCRGYSEEFYYSLIGISKTEGTQLISVLPNPSNGIFVFRPDNSNVILEIEIMNLFGQKILSTDKSEIDLSAFPEGVYFYTLKTNYGSFAFGRLLKI